MDILDGWSLAPQLGEIQRQIPDATRASLIKVLSSVVFHEDTVWSDDDLWAIGCSYDHVSASVTI